MSDQLDDFTSAYIECALWSSLDDDGEPLDGGSHDLSTVTADEMAGDCRDFQAANAAALDEAYGQDAVAYDAGQAGHDFWLTRNGHGAGFWDRGLGQLGDRLSAAAKVHGSVDLYVGDDGQI